MSDYTELKRLAEAVRDNDIDWEPNQKTYDYFQALRDPSVVLDLIAENERIAVELECPFRLARHSKRLVEELRAEVAGLRTGYEAYEQVNAELKAEVEALRGHLRLRVSAMPRDRLRETFNAAYYGPRELGSDGEQCRVGVLAVIDAAMGKGQQS